MQKSQSLKKIDTSFNANIINDVPNYVFKTYFESKDK